MVKRVAALFAALLSYGCQSVTPPVTVASDVNLQRFMGDWYVIASIPTFIEKNAYNAVESYQLDDDGSVATTFTFNEGDYDGPLKRYQPTGYVVERSGNAVWGMQFVWPFWADYRIMYLDPDYRLTIIGRDKRDYVWIMARTPTVSEQDYANAVTLLEAQGYDVSQLRRVPQRWPAAPSAQNRAVYTAGR